LVGIEGDCAILDYGAGICAAGFDDIEIALKKKVMD
jgi:hypothetical protein